MGAGQVSATSKASSIDTGREAFGMLPKPFQTETFSADRLFQIGKKNG
jgi:hypothetical protein